MTLTDEERDEICALYRDGHSISWCAEWIGCSDVEVRNVLRGVWNHGGIPKLPTTHDAKAAELYRKGLTIRDVARELDCSPTSARSALRRAGVVMRPNPRTRFPESKRAWIVALYQSGLSCRAVAKRVGCGPSVVRTIAKEAGVLRSVRAA